MSCSVTTDLVPLQSLVLERDYCVPSGVRLEDGGTLGLALLGLLTDSEHVILVDAVRTDDPPGTLVRLDGTDVMDAVRDRLSPHQVGVADLLDAARLIDSYPTAVTLLGLVPDSIELAVVRSSAVDSGTRRACCGHCSRGAKPWLQDGSRTGDVRPVSPYSRSHSPFRDVSANRRRRLSKLKKCRNMSATEKPPARQVEAEQCGSVFGC